MKNKIKRFLNDYMKWTPPKIVILLILFLPFLLYSLTKFKLDNDFWFLVNTGKYIVNNGIPYIEPFTIHTNFSFIAQQWLTDIIFYLIYNKFNIQGMYFLLVLANVLITYLLYKLSYLVSEKVKLSLFITVFIDLILILGFLTTRPQIFDIILLLLELYLLELYIKKKNKFYLLGLPIISILMINLHASFWLMLFVFLIPYYLGKINIKFAIKENYSIKPLILITIIMFLFGFINPYNINSITYLFKSYGIDYINNFIIEMMPLTIENNILMFGYFFIIIISFIITKKKTNIRYTLLLLGTTYLSLQHLKGIIYLLIASVLILNYNFKDFFPEEKNKFKKNIPVNTTIILALCLITIISFVNKEYKKEEDDPLYLITNYLKENSNNNAKIYTNYNTGGYIEYQGFKCYLDPRAEVFLKSNNKKEDILLEYTNLQNGKLNYKEFLNKYNFDYLIINTYDILATYIEDENNYTLVKTVEDNLNTVKLYKRIKE